MLYLVRFAQWHVEFRLPELNSLLTLCGVDPEAAYDRCVAAAAAWAAHGPCSP